MDLDAENYREPDYILANIINDWLGNEQLRSFHIMYPRRNDTVMAGTEGWIQFNHHHDGYATVATIHHKDVYIEYDDVVIDASDPEFFTKLKGVLRRHEAIHGNCKHLRSLHD